MNDIEKRARALELLAERYDRKGKLIDARDIRADDLETEQEIAVQAIIAALTPPEGWVLVPVVPTEAMLDAEHATAEIHDEYGEDRYVENAEAVWAAMLAARPEVFA